MITVQNLSKQFRLYQKPSDRLKEIILRRSFHRNFQALDNISFHLSQGETLGIVGPNGAGKSTLLKILTGISIPDSGNIDIKGRITGLLELGTGFNTEFTGIDNIFLNGTYTGLTRTEVEDRLDSITAFAELGRFIHEPIKTYSSGMVMRLAFSVAIHSDPVCFVVDEALSVGDTYFQQKCMRKIREFKDSGGAIVFVSHDMNAVKMLCDRAILMHQGRIMDQGNPVNVIESYNCLISKLGNDEIPADLTDQDIQGYGSRSVRIAETRLYNHDHEQTDSLVSGKSACFKIKLTSDTDTENFNVGIMFRDRFGQDIFGTNTYHLRQNLSMHAGQQMEVTFSFKQFNIGPGKYTITVAAHLEDTHINDCLHWIDRALSFEVLHGGDFFFVGIARLEPEVSLSCTSNC